jgi:hypothetical protein
VPQEPGFKSVFHNDVKSLLMLTSEAVSTFLVFSGTKV